MKGKHPRLVAAISLATIGLALGAPGTATAHGAVPIKQATFNAYATGTYLHTHLLQVEDSRLVNVNIAGSAAAVDHPKGLAQRADEMGRFVVNPEAPGKITWGRGVAIEAGLLEDVPSGDPAIAIAGVAKQSAPPTVGTPDTQDITLDLDPLLYVSLAAGEASANWSTEDPCIYKSPGVPRNPLGPPPADLAEDLGFGKGSVADVELLDLAGDDEGQEGLERPLLATNVTTGQGIKKRSVGWTASQTALVGQYEEAEAIKGGKAAGPHHGLAADVRATLLPITLLTTGGVEGETEYTIEVLGPWRLVGHAGGLPGTAWVHFGPEAEEPNTPILRISSRTIQGGVVVEDNEDVLTVEDLTGEDDVFDGGRVDLLGLGTLVIGEAPRAIGDDGNEEDPPTLPTEAADGTVVSAAADVLRLELLESAEPDGFELAEIRLGHMEVEAEVPAGGLDCEPPRKLPPTGDDEPLPAAGDDEVLAAAAPETGKSTGQSTGQATGQLTGQATGQESLNAEFARRQLPPITRAVGLFSAVAAILVTSGAMLRRRWSRS